MPELPGSTSFLRSSLFLVALTVAAVAASPVLASGEKTSIKEDARKAGRATGSALHEVGQGLKQAGKEVGAAAKEGGREFRKAIKGNK